MSWHVTASVLNGYVEDHVGEIEAFSVEAHLLSCEECRARVADEVDAERLERVWKRVLDEADAPSRGAVENLLARLGVPDHVGRLLAATPSLRSSWLLAVAAVTAFAVVAARVAPNGYTLFLIVAPLLPLAGVGMAYGRGIDPTYEIGIASPVSSFRLLLIRAAAVLTTTLTIVACGALLLPGLGWRSAAWLLPSLALTSGSLALATVVNPLGASIALGFAWSLFAASGLWEGPPGVDLAELLGGGGQAMFAAVTLVSAVALLVRSDSFERGEDS